MKIDKKMLIELLVRKTGMDSTEVEDQLDQLIRRIIDAAERGKALEIKEFGLFYFDESGDLKFDPSKELSTEINFKYAGMEPVELKPPRDSSAEPEETAEDPFAASSGSETDEDDDLEPDEAEDEDEEDLSSIFGFDEDSAEMQEEEEEADDNDDEIEIPWGRLTGGKEPIDADPQKDVDGDHDEEEEEYDDEIPEREDDPFAGLLGDASSKLSDSEKGFFEVDENEPEHPLIGKKGGTKPAGKKPPEKKKPSSEPKPKPEPAAGKEKKPEPKPKQPARPAVAAKKKEAVAEAPTARKSAAGSPARKSGRDPITVVIGVVLIFIIVAAGFLLIPGLFEEQGSSNMGPSQSGQPMAGTGQNESAQSENATEMPEDVPLETIEPPDRLSEPEPEPETAVTDRTDSESATAVQEVQGGYGLRGSLNEAANDGFSIVLHSLRQEDNARERAAELSSDGYRVLVSQRTVNGEVVWRVSVGQFETIADAQEAARTLPSPYNSNNFIQRIQTN